MSDIVIMFFQNVENNEDKHSIDTIPQVQTTEGNVNSAEMFTTQWRPAEANTRNALTNEMVDNLITSTRPSSNLSSQFPPIHPYNSESNHLMYEHMAIPYRNVHPMLEHMTMTYQPSDCHMFPQGPLCIDNNYQCRLHMENIRGMGHNYHQHHNMTYAITSSPSFGNTKYNSQCYENDVSCEEGNINTPEFCDDRRNPAFPNYIRPLNFQATFQH